MAEILAGAAYDSDWHVRVQHPERGPLEYCTGVGPDEDFDPEAANAVLAEGGWRVAGEWRETTPDECDEQYVVPVVLVPTAAAE